MTTSKQVHESLRFVNGSILLACQSDKLIDLDPIWLTILARFFVGVIVSLHYLFELSIQIYITSFAQCDNLSTSIVDAQFYPVNIDDLVQDPWCKTAVSPLLTYSSDTAVLH